MHTGLLELEQALPPTLIERFVVVGPAATRVALTPTLPVEEGGRPRLTLALTYATWADTAVSIVECLQVEGWRVERASLPAGVPTCPISQTWPIELVAPSGWRAELVLPDGFTSSERPGKTVRLRDVEVLVVSYPSGDIATFAPRPVPRLCVRVAAPGSQVLGDLLACDSPIARHNVELRQARAAHAIACAALMSKRDLDAAQEDWPQALRAAGYPIEEAMQRACSSLADTTLEHAEDLQRIAAVMLRESAPSVDEFDRAQMQLLSLMAG